MKKTLFLSTVISFAVICSCQKQDSAAEAQLAQRKTELDVREESVIQREKAVEEKGEGSSRKGKSPGEQPHNSVAASGARRGAGRS